MRSVDADSGVWLTDPLDLPQDPEAIEALIAANRARIAELRTLPAGGVNSLGDIFATPEGVSTMGALAAAVFASFVAGTMARIAPLPIDGWMQWLGALPLLGLMCSCVWTPVAMVVAGVGVAIVRAARRLARWAAQERRFAPALRVASGFAATIGVVLLVVGAYWTAPPL
jgi:hypothetical protein